jgi:hypothetical protein
MSSAEKDVPNRRRFLRAMGSASTVAVTASAAPLVTVEEAHAYDPGRDEIRARYRADSPNVQAFYRTNGYETLKKS